LPRHQALSLALEEFLQTLFSSTALVGYLRSGNAEIMPISLFNLRAILNEKHEEEIAGYGGR